MPTSEWSAITGKKSEAPTVKSDISMPRSALERELSQAEEHVVKDPDRIAHQRAVVSRHEDDGLDSAICGGGPQATRNFAAHTYCRPRSVVGGGEGPKRLKGTSKN